MGASEPGPPGLEPGTNGGEAGAAERHDPLATALSEAPHGSDVERDVRQTEGDRLGGAESGTVEHLQKRSVSEGERVHRATVREDPLRSVVAQVAGESEPEPRRVENVGGILGDGALGEQESMALPERDDEAAERRRLQPASGLVAQEGVESFALRSGSRSRARRASLVPKRKVALEVAAIRRESPRRKSRLDREISKERFDVLPQGSPFR